MQHGNPSSRRTPLERLGRQLTLALVLVLTVSMGHVAPCRAEGLVVQAPNINALPGTSGTFDVLLINNGAMGQDIAGDSLVIQLSGSAGNTIQFTNATINTVSAPYIFAQSLDANLGVPLFTNTLPDVVLMASDTGDPVSGYPGFTTVNPTQMFGLANVSYTVSSSATLGTSDAITFVLANNATMLSDPSTAGVAFTAQNGSIHVGTAIPEPSTLTLGAIAALFGMGACWLRRREGRRDSARGADTARGAPAGATDSP
jgi:PEP-CTERM motif